MTRALAAVVAVAAAVAACSSGSGKTEPLGPLSGPSAIDAAPVAEADAGPSVDDIRIAAIERAINETAPARHMCWELGAADDFRLAGTVVIRLTFAEDLATPEAELVTDDTLDTALTGCLVSVYRAYRWPLVFEPGQQVELPLAFKHPAAQYTVHFDNVPVRRDDRLTERMLLVEANTGNDAIMLSHLRLGGGRQLALRVNDETTEIHTVLDGSGSVYGWDGPKRGSRLEPGVVVYVKKGAAFGIVPDEAGIELLVFNTPGRMDGRELSSAEAKKKPRGAASHVVATIAAAKAYDIAGKTATVSIVFDAASAKDTVAYVGALTGTSGLEVPLHTHASETEVLYVLEGGGTMTVAGEQYQVRPGHAIQIPPGVEHAFAAGADGVKAIQFYSPSGPEQRFKATK